MAVRYMLCKVKEGKLQTWLDWCSRLMGEFKEEAAKTLVEEDLIREMCMVFGGSSCERCEGYGYKCNNNYVLYRHETEGDKVKKPFNPDVELNRMHDAKFKECLEIIPRMKGEGYDITTLL